MIGVTLAARTWLGAWTYPYNAATALVHEVETATRTMGRAASGGPW